MEELYFLQKGDFFIIFDNGLIKQSNFTNKKDFIIETNGNYKIIYTNTLKSQNVQIKVKENISAHITEIYNVNSFDITYNLEMEIFDNAIVDYLTIRFAENKLDYNSKVILHKNATFNQINICKINGVVSGNSVTQLNAVFSKANIKNIILNSSSKTQKHNFRVLHNSKDTESHLLNYAIVDNNSTLLVDNEGFVVENAERSNMNQVTKGIILDLESEISANPVLKIDNYNVIANHGASIGALGDEELFYLMSRGLTKQESEKLILSGYYASVINEIKDEKIREYILNNLWKE